MDQDSSNETNGRKLHVSISLDLTELRAAVREVVREEIAAGRAPTLRGPALLAKREIADALNISVATVDRFDREGAPFERVGASKRYDLAAYRGWLAARGSAPTTKAPSARIDTTTAALLEKNGLRLVGSQR